MTAPAILVDGISKQYRVGRGGRSRYPTLREAMSDFAKKRLPARGRGGQDTRSNLMWALRDVSFDVASGEVVGIIGRNGAGKSTLLKILARITKPTEGHAEVRGRVGSLLEVGTGFHPELTGRENVFLSGAILGMRRRAILDRFDQIVEFAELESFIDTPIKHYSSGMRVRLAFAVAAHLEPEILMVDEVLAVGDLAFQKKCLGKMGEVTEEGRTVLFVSHNMAVIHALCPRGILIEKGSVIADGPIGDAIETYVKRLEAAVTQDLGAREDRRGRGEVHLTDLKVLQGESETLNLTAGQPVTFSFRVEGEMRWGVSCRFTIVDSLGHPILGFDSSNLAPADDFTTTGSRFECELEGLPLVPGRYRLDIGVFGSGHAQDVIEGATFFEVEPGLLGGRPMTVSSDGARVAVPHRWTSPAGASGEGSPRPR